jgi:hypothetical protein
MNAPLYSPAGIFHEQNAISPSRLRIESRGGGKPCLSAKARAPPGFHKASTRTGSDRLHAICRYNAAMTSPQIATNCDFIPNKRGLYRELRRIQQDSALGSADAGMPPYRRLATGVPRFLL